MTEKWSSKEAKKAGQKFRREAHSIFREYQEALFKKLEEVRVIIKPRPKYFPRKVWLWFGKIFIDLDNANKALVFETPNEFLTRKHGEALKHNEAVAQMQSEQRGDEEDEDVCTHETVEMGKCVGCGEAVTNKPE